MARYVVCVFDVTEATQWMGVVEADNRMAALYQYPGYNSMFKEEFFMRYATPEEFAATYEDKVCVRDLNEMLGSFLST